jgi:hypothetical protein
MTHDPSANGNGHTNGYANGHVNGHANGHVIGNGQAAGLLADRRPPYHLEAERGVIGSVMMSESVLTEVAHILRPEHFFRDDHGVIYGAILGLYESGRAVDLVTLADELQRRDHLTRIGGFDALAEIMASVPHPANGLEYAEIVREKWIGREMIRVSEQSLSGAYGQRESVGALLSKASDRLAALGDLEPEPEASRVRPWPDPPDEAVYQGLAGDIVRMIEPHTEADPMAILGQLLVCFGNVIGRRAHWRNEGTWHYLNLFACIVGNSSKARKGTSWDHCRNLMKSCDPDWARKCLQRGLSSGEGLIWSVHDAVMRREKTGGIYREVEAEPGVDDKRALFIQTEFGSTLSILNREGNSLCGTLREAWDYGDLAAATKNNPARATGAHISVIGHVTCEELHRRLTENDAANGFANRFLWICSRRSKYLPDGGRILEVNFTDAVNRLREAIAFGADDFIGDKAPMIRDHEATDLWHEIYRKLSEPKPGLLGAVTSRGEAQVMRLACIYALLDRTKYVLRRHLEAGLAFWKYCEQSAAYIFGDQLGDPHAEKLLKALVAAGEAGLTMTTIRRKVFCGHRTLAQLENTIGLLMRAGVITMHVDKSSGGRRPITWKAVQHAGN